MNSTNICSTCCSVYAVFFCVLLLSGCKVTISIAAITATMTHIFITIHCFCFKLELLSSLRKGRLLAAAIFSSDESDQFCSSDNIISIIKIKMGGIYSVFTCCFVIVINAHLQTFPTEALLGSVSVEAFRIEF